MKPRIVLGITTYRDLRGADIGSAVYDARLRDAAEESSEMGDGMLFRTTSQLKDVLDPDADFAVRQSRLKRAFADGTFHAA